MIGYIAHTTRGSDATPMLVASILLRVCYSTTIYIVSLKNICKYEIMDQYH
jgi:hypothetical protein